MSHTNFSQLPAFRLQRKLPTEEPWNVGGGEDTESDPSCQPHVWLFPVEIICLSAQNRMPPLAAGCQTMPGDWEPGELVQITPLWGLSFSSQGPSGFHVVCCALVWEKPQRSP